MDASRIITERNLDDYLILVDPIFIDLRSRLTHIVVLVFRRVPEIEKYLRADRNDLYRR